MNTTSFLRRAVVCMFVCVFASALACSSAGEPTGSSHAASATHDRRPASVPSSYVTTPYGFFDPSCVVEVKRGETARSDGAIHDALGRMHAMPGCAKPRFDVAGRPMPVGTAGAARVAAVEPAAASSAFNGWIESYNTTAIGAVSALSATWVVPAAPATPNDGQTIYFFNGLEGVPNVESILQPVLGFSGGRWTATSWNCCASGTTFTGNTIDVNTGDVIVGTVTGSSCHSSGLCDSWVIETRDETTGESSILQTESWGVALNWTFAAVLEVYGVASCDDLPASGRLAFGSQSYTAITGGSPAADWQLGAPSSSAPSCGYGGQVNGSTVTLDFTGAGSVTSAPSSGGGGYAASCTGTSLQGNNVLASSCRTLSGASRSTTLDLGTCFANIGGALEPGAGGNYAASCSGCSMSGSTLTCQCAGYTGVDDTTAIDVDAAVSNCNGALTCGPC